MRFAGTKPTISLVPTAGIYRWQNKAKGVAVMTDRGIAPGHNYLWDLATAEASSLRKWKEGRVPRSLVVLLPLS